MYMNIFGQRLKETRTSLNISAQELADTIKVNKATIHRYEKGEFKSIKQNKLEEISKYLGVNSSWLIGESSTKYNLNTLTQKETLEISDILTITTELIQQKNVTFNNIPATEETKKIICDSIEIGIELAKRKVTTKNVQS